MNNRTTIPNNSKSPCNDKCNRQDEYCTGCHRTIDEITRWGYMTNEEKQEVYENIEKRRRQHDR